LFFLLFIILLWPHAFVNSPDVCINRVLQCDGTWDCPNGEDEMYCGITNGCSEKNVTKTAQFQCRETKKCVPLNTICDGRLDCRDGYNICFVIFFFRYLL